MAITPMVSYGLRVISSGWDQGPCGPSANTPNQSTGFRIRAMRQVLEPPANCAPGNSGGSRGRCDPAIAGGTRLARRKASSSTLVQLRRQGGVAFTNGLGIDHAAILRTPPVA